MLPFLDDQHFLAFLINVARLCAWPLILAVIFLPLERLSALHREKIFHKAIAIDRGYYFLRGLLPGLLLTVRLSLVAWGPYRVVPYSLHAAVVAWPLWLRALAGLVVGEVGFY